MSENPLFSVLIANYNNGKYLMDAIESVRQQTYTKWEIILVDDASTDNSCELYQELETDSRVHIYYNEKNMGCGYTKARCAALAIGEICGFLDADDKLDQQALSIMVDGHIQNQDASIVNSTYYITDAELNIQRISTNEHTIEDGHSFLQDRGGIAPFASFKKLKYNQTEGVDVNMRRAIDNDLYYKLEEVGRVVYIDKPLYYYRIGTGNNISKGESASRTALWWDVYAMVQACMRRGLSVEKIAFQEIEIFVKESRLAGANVVRQSKTYKLGCVILNPLKKIRMSLNL